MPYLISNFLIHFIFCGLIFVINKFLLTCHEISFFGIQVSINKMHHFAEQTNVHGNPLHYRIPLGMTTQALGYDSSSIRRRNIVHFGENIFSKIYNLSHFS